MGADDSTRVEVTRGIGQLSGIALECRDPHALAAFYSALTGWPTVFSSPDWVSIGESAGATWHLSFQRAPGHVPPRWPDAASSMQFHLHFRVDDIQASEAHVLALGATKLESADQHVYADPAGHVFCLVAARRPIRVQ
jgi:catechol 2,3-dioxygenase-like lactoylglutathione lyase family enzyme